VAVGGRSCSLVLSLMPNRHLHAAADHAADSGGKTPYMN